MATAEIVMDGLPSPGGYEATLYRIDPPIQGTDHVLVYHRPKIHGQPGQMSVILATPGGVGYGGRMDAVQGTYVTDEPNHHLALQLAGGYSIVEPEAATVPTAESFDPSGHTVNEVNTYLETAEPAERDRVINAERVGKARKGILGGN